MATRRGHREGSIFQRHDHPACPPVGPDGIRPAHRCRGRWVAMIDNGTINKKRDRRTVYGRTRAEVAAKLDDLKARAPIARSSEMPTVGQWLDEWLAQYKSDLKRQSRIAYEKDVRNYLTPLFGRIRLDRLTTLQIEQMDTRLRMPCPDPTPEGKCPHKPSHGLSYATARRAYTVLCDALGDAVKARKINESPGTNASGPSKKRTAGVVAAKPEAHLSPAVADAVLAVAQATDDAARWHLALEQGLRAGEALGLPWSLVDLDSDQPQMSIARTVEDNGQFGTPKSDAGYRTIPILPGTLAALRRRRAAILAAGGTITPDARIFEASMDADRAAWRRLLKKAGVPHVRLHSARQTAARRFEENGVPVRVAAQFFGWEDEKMVYHYQRNAEVAALRRAIEG